jgi:hypothetical protein
MTDIVWKTLTLPDAVVGAPYEAGLAFTGNATAVTACVVKGGSGALPTGLAVNADLVRLTGTPKAVAGVYTFKLTITDTAGAVDSGTFTLRVRDGFDRSPGDVNSDSPASQNGRAWPLQL